MAPQVTSDENAKVVANCDHLKKLKFSPSLPYAFTEHGAIMLASVINSPRAIEASIYVVRAFVNLRDLLSTRMDIVQKLNELEKRLEGHDKHIRILFAAIRQLMTQPECKKQKIDFRE